MRTLWLIIFLVFSLSFIANACDETLAAQSTPSESVATLSVQQLLEKEVAAAIKKVTGKDAPAMVLPTANTKFGDYQANGAMQIAKTLKDNPREMGKKVMDALIAKNIPGTFELAGAGFINFTLDRDWLSKALTQSALGKPLGFLPAAQRETIVVDFSSPNIAKSMHVGHIRSTIIGDSISRSLRHLGHYVITDNHVGDWGTAFGKMIVAYRTYLDREAYEQNPLAEMERIYQKFVADAKENPSLDDQAREELAKLQAGDEENIRLWKEFLAVSRTAFEEIYDKLGVKFDHWLGESFYNPMLGPVVQELCEKGLAKKSDGAICVFFDGESGLRDTPFLIEKKDGAHLYGTTDLATIKYRVDTFNPDQIVYITDSRQALHFKQLFQTATLWGYTTNLEHVTFGMILGDDGTAIKTREGNSVKLGELLDEAELRARAILTKKHNDLGETELARLARIIGIGAVKYADLKQDRQTDYKFDWDKLLAFEGNTAYYIQATQERASQLVADWQPSADFQPNLEFEQELALAKILIRFQDIVASVGRTYNPHILVAYVHELATAYNSYSQSIAADPSKEHLLLAHLTANTLKKGLELLGIETLN